MKLIPIDGVYPSAYNPRIADPKRLELIALSIRKLGFVLPIYADANGEILSGHQRHLVAKELLHLTHVPVSYTRSMDLEERRAVNVVFNRATNDLHAGDLPKTLTEALERSNVYEIAESLPDLEGDALYPCLQAQEVQLEPLLAANSGRWITHARNVSKTIGKKGVVMPIVATANHCVVNGIGRLQYLAERKKQSAMVVFISPEQARLADIMLNLLSMDFDIHRRYADVLRHNSFRRARQPRNHLGPGKTYPMTHKQTKPIDMDSENNRLNWIKFFGKSVLDFGAGRFHEVNMLQKWGVDAVGFEPYCLREGSDSIDYDLSIERTRAFLAEVAKGTLWKSIFISAVFNSVPFKRDREYIVTLVHALCSPFTRVFSNTHSTFGSNLEIVQQAETFNMTQAKTIIFDLGYEPNTLIGEYGSKPKVQKYFTHDELGAYFTPHFQAVDVRYNSDSLHLEASNPKKVNLPALAEAIAFEFDLPYPNDKRMGLAEEAKAAFSKRLGVKL